MTPRKKKKRKETPKTRDSYPPSQPFPTQPLMYPYRHSPPNKRKTHKEKQIKLSNYCETLLSGEREQGKRKKGKRGRSQGNKEDQYSIYGICISRVKDKKRANAKHIKGAECGVTLMILFANLEQSSREKSPAKSG